MSQILPALGVITFLVGALGLIAWSEIRERREAAMVAGQMLAVAGAYGLAAAPAGAAPLPASTGLGGAHFFARGAGGSVFVFQLVPSSKYARRSTLVARWVGDFPGVSVWGTHSLPVIGVMRRENVGWSYRLQVGEGVSTGDPRFDQRFVVYVTLSMGLTGPTMVEGRIPLRPEVIDAFLRLPANADFYFDGRLAVVTYPEWGVDASSLAPALHALEAFSRVAAELSAWRLSAV